MMVLAFREKEIQADIMVREHHDLTQEILRCIRGVGETAKPRISLFVEKAGDDGQMDTSGL